MLSPSFNRRTRLTHRELVSKIYPPTTHSDLRELHNHIVASASPDHHKCSVLYYLVKDVMQKYNAGNQLPCQSANGSHLPPNYKTFIDGIWQLDRLRFEVCLAPLLGVSRFQLLTVAKKALDYLTEPALTPTFPDDILYTLCKHAPQDNVSLPVAYYHSVSPPLASSKVLETYFLTLCRASITEAFYWSRAQGEVKHQILFKKLIEFVLSQPSGDSKADQGVELISLPFDEQEEAWFREDLIKAKPEAVKGAADTLIMRNIALGRTETLDETVGLAQNKKIDGVDWGSLTTTMKQASV